MCMCVSVSMCLCVWDGGGGEGRRSMEVPEGSLLGLERASLMVNFMCWLGGHIWMRLAFRSVNSSKQTALYNMDGSYPIS